MQLGFSSCLFHFPFYYYYLLFLTVPSRNFFPPRPSSPACRSRGGLEAGILAHSAFSPSCVCPLKSTVSGKLPFSFRKRYWHSCGSSRSQKLHSHRRVWLGSRPNSILLEGICRREHPAHRGMPEDTKGPELSGKPSSWPRSLK